MNQMTKEQAFAACREMQAEFFWISDLLKDGGEVTLSAMTTTMMAGICQRMAVKAGQVAGYVMPPPDQPPPGPIAQIMGPLSGLGKALKAYPPPSVSGYRPGKSDDGDAA